VIDLIQKTAYYNKVREKVYSHAEGKFGLPINVNAPVLSRSEIVIDAPIEKVWTILTNVKQ